MKKLTVALVLWTLVAGCTFPNHRADLRIREDIANGGPELSLNLLQSVGVPMLRGNKVDLVENGRVFDAMEAEILSARSSIHILTFIWRPSPPSTRLVEAILSRTRQGVACRIIYDPFGSIGFSKEVRKILSSGGCDVRPFRPFGPGERLRILARTHRKIVIIDGKVGVTGGFGIWWSWMGNGLSPDEWRDSNVVVRGPAVYQMQVAFAQGWQEAGGPLLPADVFPSIAPQGSSSAAFVASEPRAEDTNAERLVQLAIASAHHRLWIANSYFIPSTAICDSLIRKAEQGVDVRILAPGRYMDIAPVRAAQRSTYDTLLSHGIRVWEYEISMMHAKTILVDDRLVVIGSTNMDPLSLRRNEEGALVVESPELAADLDRSWRVDLLHSREIRWDSWKKRGLVERFTRRLTSIIGSFL